MVLVATGVIILDRWRLEERFGDLVGGGAQRALGLSESSQSNQPFFLASYSNFTLANESKFITNA